MKTIKSLGLALALIAIAALPVAAQTTVTSTTFSAAVGQTDAVVTLGSGTGVAVGTELYSDLEAFYVVGPLPASGTTYSVTRGVDGTTAAAHASGNTVYVGGTGNNGPFVRSNPPVGACTATNELFNLRINTRSGDVWRCLNSAWTTLNDPRNAALKNMPVGAAVASVAGVIAPVSGFFHITGALAITGITPPTGCVTNGCQITVIPDGAFTTTTASNIAIASTAVVSKALIFTYDPVAAKWYPSY